MLDTTFFRTNKCELLHIFVRNFVYLQSKLLKYSYEQIDNF